MNYEKYLPLGSIVMLKGASKRMMIIGFCCVDGTDKSKIYDYSGCLYPEGVISSDKSLLFDHNQIDKIYHIGYKDEEEQRFQERLKEMLNKKLISNEEI